MIPGIDMHTHRIGTLLAVAVAALGAASCTVANTPAPPLTGPSELSLSLAVTATPDLIAANGASQSAISIVARDPNGQTRSDVQLRIDTVDSSGVIIDIGTLSRRTITTGSNGQAVVTFTAPMETVPGVDVNGTVTVRITPI